MDDKIRVLKFFKEEGKVLYEKQFLDNDLKSFQESVNGKIEVPFVSDLFNGLGIDVIVNDESNILELEPTLGFVDRGNNVVGVIQGNIVFVSHDDKGEFVSLTDEQLDIIINSILDATLICSSTVGRFSIPAMRIY